MRVGSLHRRLNGLSEQLVQKLADERPHLLHRLRAEGERNAELEKHPIQTLLQMNNDGNDVLGEHPTLNA